MLDPLYQDDLRESRRSAGAACTQCQQFSVSKEKTWGIAAGVSALASVRAQRIIVNMNW
jgi:hypothetical protein